MNFYPEVLFSQTRVPQNSFHSFGKTDSADSAFWAWIFSGSNLITERKAIVKIIFILDIALTIKKY